MPLTRISMLAGRSSEAKAQIKEVVSQTVVDKLHVPASDRFVLIEEFDRENFSYDPNCLDIERSDGFLIVQIVLNAGRTSDVKKNFMKPWRSSSISNAKFVPKMCSSI